MTDWYAEVTQPNAPAPAAGTDWWKEVSGPSLTAAPAGTKFGGPDVADTLDTKVNTGAIARSSLAVDPNTQIKRLSESTGIPLNRWGIVDGNIVYSDPQDNQIKRAIPSVFGGDRSKGLLPYAGETLQRGARWAASGAGPAIPQGTAAAIGTIMGPTGASIPAAGGGAAIADLGRQALDKALADEPIVSTDYDLANAAGHGVQAMAGQGIGVGINRALSRNPMQISAYDRKTAMDPATLTNARANVQAGQQEGVDLSFGQATGLRSALVSERQLARDPAGMDTLSGFYDKQRGQINQSLERLARGISPVKSGQEGASMLREGADAAIQAQLAERAAKAKPLYDVAYAQPMQWTDDLSGIMKRPAMIAGWKKAQEIAANEGHELPQILTLDKSGTLVTGVKAAPDWKTVDYIKRGLDDVIQGAKNPMTGRIEGDAPRAIVALKQQFLSEVDKINPAYAAARAQFSSDSPAVQALLDGPVGRMARDRVTDISRQTSEFFGPGRMSPEAVKEARSAYAKANAHDEWNAGLATYIRDVMQKTNASPTRLTNELFGREFDPRAREIMQAAMTPQQYAGFEHLMKVVQNAARTLPEGSQTATDIAGGQALRNQFGGSAKMLGNMFSPMRITDVAGRAGERVALKMSDEGMAKLAEAVTNPKSVEQLQKLRMFRPESEKAMALASQIIFGSGVRGAESRLFRPRDQMPSAESAP
jgi:hypothetical protein